MNKEGGARNPMGRRWRVLTKIELSMGMVRAVVNSRWADEVGIERNILKFGGWRGCVDYLDSFVRIRSLVGWIRGLKMAIAGRSWVNCTG